jgi:hypothetical protein
VKLWIFRNSGRCDEPDALQELRATIVRQPFEQRRADLRCPLDRRFRQGRSGRSERDPLNSSVGPFNCSFDKTSSFQSIQQL